MEKFEQLLLASIENQKQNNTKVLNNARTWFTYETPGQPNSDNPYIVTPNGTFQPVVESYTYNKVFCPICGENTVSRERRIGGNDTCRNNHTYPSKSAIDKNEVL